MRAEKLPLPAPQAEDRFRELIAQIGSEIGQSLSSAMERVTVLATTGKIDRPGLRALREEIERARRAGIMGQQIARVSSGRIRQTHETLSLTQMARDVLVQRGRELAARGLEAQQAMRPVEVVVDATLLHSLLHTLLDWTLEHAIGQVEFRIDLRPWPRHARLSCRFVHATASPADTDLLADPEADTDQHAVRRLDSLSWRLLQQLAWALRLVIERQDAPDGSTSVTIDFPQTITEQLDGVIASEIDQGFGVSDNSKPLAGAQVLVLSSRRDLRSDIREATRHMGLVVDFVGSVEEAEQFCADAVPQALIFESGLAGQRFERLRQGLASEVPTLVFVEITEEGDGFSLSSESRPNLASVGRHAVPASLPSVLIFELSRSL